MHASSSKETLVEYPDDRAGFTMGDGNATYDDVVSGRAQERAKAASKDAPETGPGEE